ncbi:MAG TPA: hypothetical protein VNA19_07950 [Pyrinomonadaceae bacterium]|jgi:hypothetical protein|nr:hypothetical protein [Pyrinomonadaceae bacterium]
MKYNGQQILKLFTLALALALAASTLMFGTAPAKTSAANYATVQEERVGATPRAESIEATPLERETEEGNALVLVRFMPDQKVEPVIKTVISDRDVVLRDDGQESDESAGDGTYTTVAFIDFNALADNQDRVSELNAQADTSEETASASTRAAATDGTGDESLASSDSVLMPAFESGRDRQGTKEIPKVDFRNLKPGQFVPLFPLATYKGVDPTKSLVITHVKVVEDPSRTFNPCSGKGTPMGAWTFGRLMTDMANQPLTGIPPSTFVRKWLDKWMADQTTANGWTAAKRQAIKQLVIDPWEAASGGPGAPLNLAKAPFKLLAIVNRVDLRSAGTAYGGGNAGEGRFVFGVMDMRPTGGIDPYTGQPTPACTETQFTVILEYGIDRRGCLAIQNWGWQWYNLKYYFLGTPSYNAALQAITDQFTKPNVAPHKPNGSALNQLRTNEIALRNPPSDPFWQLREFRLPQGNGHLFEANAKQTPHESLRNTDLTANYVNANTPAILNGTYVVPDFWLGQKFLTNASDVPGGPPPPATVFWNNGPTVNIINRQARHLFSLGTCNSCHHSETMTAFTHIKPAPFGSPAGLSGFMTGIWVQDPADPTPMRNFNEFKRRAIDLDNLVHTPCFLHMLNNSVLQVH